MILLYKSDHYSIKEIHSILTDGRSLGPQPRYFQMLALENLYPVNPSTESQTFYMQCMCITIKLWPLS